MYFLLLTGTEDPEQIAKMRALSGKTKKVHDSKSNPLPSHHRGVNRTISQPRPTPNSPGDKGERRIADRLLSVGGIAKKPQSPRHGRLSHPTLPLSSESSSVNSLNNMGLRKSSKYHSSRVNIS